MSRPSCQGIQPKANQGSSMPVVVILLPSAALKVFYFKMQPETNKKIYVYTEFIPGFLWKSFVQQGGIRGYAMVRVDLQNGDDGMRGMLPRLFIGSHRAQEQSDQRHFSSSKFGLSASGQGIHQHSIACLFRTGDQPASGAAWPARMCTVCTNGHGYASHHRTKCFASTIRSIVPAPSGPLCKGAG